MSHPGRFVGIKFIGGKTEKMQPAQATALPIAQIVPQVDNPAPTAPMISLSWLMMTFAMEMLHSTVLMVVAVVSVVPVRVVLADVGQISCVTNRPATMARTMSFCACFCIMESLRLILL